MYGAVIDDRIKPAITERYYDFRDYSWASRDADKLMWEAGRDRVRSYEIGNHRTHGKDDRINRLSSCL